MQKYFRHKKNRTIFMYSDRLLNNPAVELVTEQEAFPERFASKAVLEHKQKVDISIPKEAVEVPPYTPPELAAEATKKMRVDGVLPQKRKEKVVVSDKPLTPADFTGLIED